MREAGAWAALPEGIAYVGQFQGLGRERGEHPVAGGPQQNVLERPARLEPVGHSVCVGQENRQD